MQRVLLAIPTILLCSCATAAVSQRSGPLAATDFVVRGIEANQDSAHVVATLGAPDSVSIGPNPYDAASHLTWLIYPAMRVQMADGKVLGVALTAAGQPSPRGLRVGDPAERVQALYGDASGRFPDVLEYPDPTDPTGHHVMRVTTADGRVSSIFIGWVLD